MKKTISILMACAMIAATTVGCSNNRTIQNNAQTQNTTAEEQETMNTETEKDNADVDKLPEKSEDATSNTTISGKEIASDDNMDISFVSADAKNGIIFKVNNKTSKNLEWYFDSIAINGVNINDDDIGAFTNNIAPYSMGEFIISPIDDSLPKSKYDWSQGVKNISGQFYYYTDNDLEDCQTVTFSINGDK